tara:strand:+ start:40136 stop:40954 length:819 start_codon:yes stop_codon:yes gene_type:complete
MKPLNNTIKQTQKNFRDNNMLKQNIRKIVMILLPILVLTGISVKAQIAPEFSNKILPDNETYFFFIADRLEYYSIEGLNPIIGDVQGYIGKDYNKFWFKAEGEALTAEKEGEMELQGLYSRPVATYFDVQVGLRYDVAYNSVSSNSRGFAVLGMQGLAPYLFEVDGSIQLSEDGDLSGSFEGELDLLVTQRLIIQPRLTTSVAVQKVEEFGVGSGLNNIQLGLRLRYEIKREFAPYVGISWNRKLSETADLAKLEGADISVFGVVAGVRLWY